MSTDPAASQLLVVGPVCLRIRSHDPAIIEFLARATQPAFRLVSTTHTPNVDDIRVLTHNALPDRLRTTLRPGATDAQPREPHQVIDGLHLVEKTAGTAPDNRHGYLLWTDDAPSSSHILLADDTPPSRTVLLRLLRGIAARALLAAGWIPLHAACVRTAAGAVCLLGERQRGKTTALMHLLAGAAGRVALVANSIVFLAPDGPPRVRTLPTAIGIRPATLAPFPVLRDQTTAGDDTRVYVPSDHLARVFRVEQDEGGPLAAFVTIHYHGQRPSTWQPLAHDAARVALQQARLPDGLLDDPHEHARLDPCHDIGHHQCLDRYADVPAAILHAGHDTAPTLGEVLRALLAQSVRTAAP